MKTLTALVLAVFIGSWSSAGYAIDQVEKRTETITCSLPLTNTDGSLIKDGEIVEVRFFANMQQIGSSATCDFVYDISQLPDGTYNYTAVAVTAAAQSEHSLPVERVYAIKKIPNRPTGMTVE